MRAQWRLADAAVCDGGDGKFLPMEARLPRDPQSCCRDTLSTLMPGTVVAGSSVAWPPWLKAISFQQVSFLLKLLKSTFVVLNQDPEGSCHN